MKRWIAAVALSGGLIGGGVGVPLALTAQPAFAKAGNCQSTPNSFNCQGGSGARGGGFGGQISFTSPISGTVSGGFGHIGGGRCDFFFLGTFNCVGSAPPSP